MRTMYLNILLVVGMFGFSSCGPQQEGRSDRSTANDLNNAKGAGMMAQAAKGISEAVATMNMGKSRGQQQESHSGQSAANDQGNAKGVGVMDQADKGNGEAAATKKAGRPHSEVALTEGICILEKSERSAFEVACPFAIKRIKYEFFSAGTGLDLNGSVNGKQMDLKVKKVGDNRVHGRTTNSDVTVVLELIDGRREIIRID
jgi:hypothetical protein